MEGKKLHFFLTMTFFTFHVPNFGFHLLKKKNQTKNKKKEKSVIKKS